MIDTSTSGKIPTYTNYTTHAIAECAVQDTMVLQSSHTNLPPPKILLPATASECSQVLASTFHCMSTELESRLQRCTEPLEEAETSSWCESCRAVRVASWVSVATHRPLNSDHSFTLLQKGGGNKLIKAK